MELPTAHPYKPTLAARVKPVYCKKSRRFIGCRVSRVATAQVRIVSEYLWQAMTKRTKQPLIACALREALADGYAKRDFVRDALSGLVVGIIAIPLSMALAIACGMPPETGLYTAMIAGFFSALVGGSRVQVSGPTAAFVVILAPIVSQHGPTGLLLASLLAGVFLLGMGCFRMGRLVEFIPYPVTAGFTLGIALTIALIQVKDFVGITFTHQPESNLDRAELLIAQWSTWHAGDAAIGVFTFVALLLWGRSALGKRVPGAIVVLPCSIMLAMALAPCGDSWQASTIDSRFGSVVDGIARGGIPTTLPRFALPWNEALASEHLGSIVKAAIAIALLGAIESLLSAVIADAKTNHRHHPDGELVGQGIGNIIAPFFGGFAATGALARTAANIRAGAISPVSSMVHAIFILCATLLLAPVLGWLPMASLAALLFIVAMNMADLRHCVFVVRNAPRGDALVLIVCFVLTVSMDMVIAVSVGVVLAALIFMRRMAELSGVDLGEADGATTVRVPHGVLYYRVRGPLFFGAAERAMQEVRTSGTARYAVIDLSGVPMIDATGIVNLESAVDRLWRAGIPVVLAAANPRVLAFVKAARFPWEAEGATFASSVDEAFRTPPRTAAGFSPQ